MQIDLKTLFGNTTELEEKFVLKVLKSFKDHSKESSDYLKFKQSVAALKELNLDESIRLKSAFSTAQTMGLSKADLIKSAQGYLSALKKEQEQFAIALKNQIDQKIKNTEEKKLKYQKEAEAINAKIEKLKLNQKEYLEAAAALDEQILSSSEKIDETRNHFIKTYDYFKGIIDEDLDKIHNQLS